MGSEMCIRDRVYVAQGIQQAGAELQRFRLKGLIVLRRCKLNMAPKIKHLAFDLIFEARHQTIGQYHHGYTECYRADSQPHNIGGKPAAFIAGDPGSKEIAKIQRAGTFKWQIYNLYICQKISG